MYPLSHLIQQCKFYPIPCIPLDPHPILFKLIYSTPPYAFQPTHSSHPFYPSSACPAHTIHPVHCFMPPFVILSHPIHPIVCYHIYFMPSHSTHHLTSYYTIHGSMPPQPLWELHCPKVHSEPTLLPSFQVSSAPWVILTALTCPQTSCRQWPRALHCTACSRFWHQNLGPCAQSGDEADPGATAGVRTTFVGIQHALGTLHSPYLHPTQFHCEE